MVVFRLWLAPAVAVALGVGLGGCQFSSDGGVSTARSLATAELGKDVVKIATEADADSASFRVRALLKKPLSADAAVQIALLNNRGLQASFNELGIAEARMVADSLPPNPKFGLSRLGGDLDLEIERQVALNILAILTLPARAEVAADRFRGAQLKAAESVFKLAADTRRQYYRAVAANQQVGYLSQARETAEATSELVKRLGESGALNKLEQAREHALYVEIGAQLAKARLQQKLERERLVRQMGLWGADIAFKLPSSLPALPARLASAKDLEGQALRKRVDLQIARGDLDLTAKELGLTNVTRFVNDIDLVGTSNFERSKPSDPAGEKSIVNRAGLGLEFEIPLYDFGQTKVVRAEETYLQAANRLAEKAITVRSEVREAYAGYRGNHDLARYFQTQVLPLRKIIQDESLLQYSGMLIDVTTLIVDARARILSNAQAIEARRDFWIADVDFKHAVIGGGLGGGGGGGTAVAQAEAGGAAAH